MNLSVFGRVAVFCFLAASIAAPVAQAAPGDQEFVYIQTEGGHGRITVFSPNDAVFAPYMANGRVLAGNYYSQQAVAPLGGFDTNLSVGPGVTWFGNGFAGQAGISFGSGSLTIDGGTIYGLGNGNHMNASYGVYLRDGDLFLNSGVLIGRATGVPLSEGYGVYLQNGNYQQTGGVLRLLPTKNNPAVAMSLGGTAWFGPGAELQIGLTFDALGVGHGGLLDATGGAVTLNGSTLRFTSFEALGDSKVGDSATNIVINALGGLNLNDVTVLSPWTMRVSLARSANNLTATYTRTAMPSQLLSGGGQSFVRQMEDSHIAMKDWIDKNMSPEWTNDYKNLIDYAYDIVDSSANEDEGYANARGLTPWGATMLATLGIQTLDLTQDNLHNQVAVLARLPAGGVLPFVAESTPGAGDSPGSAAGWQVWATPLYSYARLDAKTKSFADVDGYFAGVSAGAAKRFAPGVLGVSLNYLYGDFDGGGFESESDTFGLAAAFRTNNLNPGGAFDPWLLFSAGYNYTEFDLKRRDVFGYLQTSSPRQHALRLDASIGQDFYPQDNLRLTPVLGFDYSHIQQSDFSEENFGWRLEGKSASMNSLRGKLGGELEYLFGDCLAADAHAFYRLEMLDTHMDIDSSYLGYPAYVQMEGQDLDRSSGNAGLGLTWNIQENIRLRGSYDITLGDHYQAHQFGLTFGLEF